MMNTGTDSEHPVRCAQPTVYSARIPRTEAGSRVDRGAGGAVPELFQSGATALAAPRRSNDHDSRVKASCKIRR